MMLVALRLAVSVWLRGSNSAAVSAVLERAICREDNGCGLHLELARELNNLHSGPLDDRETSCKLPLLSPGSSGGPLY